MAHLGVLHRSPHPSLIWPLLGTSRHLAAMQRFGCSRSEVDIQRAARTKRIYEDAPRWRYDRALCRPLTPFLLQVEWISKSGWPDKSGHDVDNARMAETDRKLANGKGRIDFETD